MRESQRSRYTRQKKLLLYAVFAVIGGFVLFKVIPALFAYSSIGIQTVFDKNITLKKTDDRVNLLILGIGGGSHEGPNLTDTLIFASLDPEKKKVTLVSIPRDLWVPELQAKINTAYSSGQVQEEGGGLKLTKAVVSKILGQPIDYGMRIDFDGFVRAVDMLGGLDITVDRTLDDYAYPVTGKEDESCGKTEEEIASLSAQIATSSASESEAFPCRYEHLHFDEGPTHMDGMTALKFVRSRHALGVEGSDFARSQRQEKVIQAFKDKVFSIDTFLNPLKLVSLYDVLKGSIDTDIKQEEYDDFIKLARKMQEAKVESVIMDFGDEASGREGLLTNPPISNEYGGQWVITPKAGNGNYATIQAFVACEIKGEHCLVTPSPSIPR